MGVLSIVLGYSIVTWQPQKQKLSGNKPQLSKTKVFDCSSYGQIASDQAGLHEVILFN